MIVDWILRLVVLGKMWVIESDLLVLRLNVILSVMFFYYL